MGREDWEDWEAYIVGVGERGKGESSSHCVCWWYEYELVVWMYMNTR